MNERVEGQPLLQLTSEVSKLPVSSPRKAVLVLGMHRSGTSALGGVLSALGVAAPKTLASSNQWNPRGYFESPRIFAAHDELLASIGSCWSDWRRLDPRWLDSKSAQHHQAIKSVLIDEFGGEQLIFLKDPRICRFVPFMCSILAELDFNPVAVLQVRNPLEVAYSLKRRDDIALSNAVRLWLRHVLDAEVYSRGIPRCFLSYEDLLTDWRHQAERIAAQTGLEWPDDPDRSNSKIEEFLTPELRRERFTSDDVNNHPEIMPSAKDTYNILLRIVAGRESDELLDRLDLLRTTFDEECGTADLMNPDRARGTSEIV